MTDQSPASQAATSSALPEARSRCLYASASMKTLLSTLLGMNTRAEPGHWVGDDLVAEGAGST